MSAAALLVEVGGLLNFCEATPAQEHFAGEELSKKSSEPDFVS